MPLEVEDLLVHRVVGPRKWLVQTEFTMASVLGTKVRVLLFLPNVPQEH